MSNNKRIIQSVLTTDFSAILFGPGKLIRINSVADYDSLFIKYFLTEHPVSSLYTAGKELSCGYFDEDPHNRLIQSLRCGYLSFCFCRV